MADALVILYFLLLGIGALGVPFGLLLAMPKEHQPYWNWASVLRISVPSPLLVVVLLGIFFVVFAIAVGTE